VTIYNWRPWGGCLRVKTARGRATIRQHPRGWEYRVEQRAEGKYKAICAYTTNPEGWHVASTLERAKAKAQEWLEVL
jgi:uncharacterized protein YbdZ (MbtH family)